MFDDADFAHLEPVGTQRYVLRGAGGRQVHIRNHAEPVALILKCSSTDERYQNALIKAPKKSGDESEVQTVELFAKHVVVGWENVPGKDGGNERFTYEAAAELLLKLRDHKRRDIVLGVLAFAANADNFTPPVADAGDLGNE